MNPNFDFRNSEAFDETPINESIGDLLPSHKALGISAVIVSFIVAILVVL